MESSSSPGAPPRSASLEGHASSSESAPGDTSSQFTSAPTSPSPSIPGNQSVESSPNAEQKESLHFLSEDQLLNFWKKEAIRAFHEGLETVDPQGNIGRIPEIEIEDALRMSSFLQTKEQMEKICMDLRNRPWPSYQEADRNSIYARIWALLEKHKRPEI